MKYVVDFFFCYFGYFLMLCRSVSIYDIMLYEINDIFRISVILLLSLQIMYEELEFVYDKF